MIFSLLIVCSSISQIRLSFKSQSWSQKKKLSKTFKLVQINNNKKNNKIKKNGISAAASCHLCTYFMAAFGKQGAI